MVYGKVTRISTPAGCFDEVLAPGAFSSALRSARGTPFVLEHNPRLNLGLVGYEVTVEDEPLHLAMVAELPDTELGRRVLRLVRSRWLRGMSFRALMDASLDATWHRQESGEPLRVVHRFQVLRDLTVTAHPAFPTAVLKEHSRPPHWEVQHRQRTVERRLASTGVLSAVGPTARPPAALERYLATCGRAA